MITLTLSKTIEPTALHKALRAALPNIIGTILDEDLITFHVQGASESDRVAIEAIIASHDAAAIRLANKQVHDSATQEVAANPITRLSLAQIDNFVDSNPPGAVLKRIIRYLRAKELERE